MIKIPKLTNDTVKTTDEVIQETFTLMQSAFTKKEYDDDPFKFIFKNVFALLIR